ncbi:MAG TPA: carboxylating nicotinate-nucleotide diphosphorylase [Candidatus Glassbacteria bacterium]|nr:carboxylating nicotinate-nucleotide diphosphorylase [Candidatus Glassbacteria bacterium]
MSQSWDVDNFRLSEQGCRLIDQALTEDIGPGDYSSQWAVPSGHASRARIVARAAGLITGIPVARYILTRFDPAPQMVSAMSDGQVATAGQVVAEMVGPTRALLSLERTLLNFLQRLSGIATLASRFVQSVEGTGVKILDTRKTTPCLRELEKYAVRVGGAFNHRFGLFDYVLLKENHIASAGGITAAVKAVRRNNRGKLSVEVETRTLDEVREAAKAGVNRIMLDNMTVEQMRHAVEIIRQCCGEKRPEIEASGDINLRTAPEVADTGVDYISVGALTHSAGILNLTMLIEPEGDSRHSA